MTKEELVEIFTLIEGAYQLTLSSEKRKTTMRAWWRYLGEFSKDEVMVAVDNHVTSEPYPPRVGEIRRTVIDQSSPGLPDPTEAYSQARQAADHAAAGLEPPGLHPLVSQALREARFDLRGFETSYRKLYDQAQIQRYGLTGVSDGD